MNEAEMLSAAASAPPLNEIQAGWLIVAVVLAVLAGLMWAWLD